MLKVSLVVFIVEWKLLVSLVVNVVRLVGWKVDVVWLVLMCENFNSVLISVVRCWLLCCIMVRCLCVYGVSLGWFSVFCSGFNISVNGVWNLWLMLEKNCVLVWFSWVSFLVLCCCIL